jgi:hypothetical protein
MSKNSIFWMSFLFSLPIFVSITDEWSVSFSRYVYDNVTYVGTVPVSFLISSISIFLFFPIYFLRKEIAKGVNPLYGYILLVLLLFASFSFLSNAPKSFLIFIFIIVFYSCSFRIFENITQKNYFNLIKYLFLFQFIYAISSHFVVSWSTPPPYLGTLIPDIFVIYNYEQYYSLGCAISVCLIYLNKHVKILYKMFFVVAAFYIGSITGNITSQLFVICVIFIFFLNSLLKQIFKMNLKPYFLIGGSFFLISIPLAAWFFNEFFSSYVGSPSSHGLWARIITHHKWIDVLSFNEIFMPLTSAHWYSDFGWQPHHQLYNSLFYGGIFFLFINLFFNLFIISKVFSSEYIVFGLFYFLVGASLEPLTHPFLFLQFYLLAAASRALRNNHSAIIN